jgi:very-short-patch-repair endonuclease
VSPEAITLFLDPAPDDAPAIVAYRPEAAAFASVSEGVGSILGTFEEIATRLYPAWLPGAETINWASGIGVTAVRALATERAAATNLFGPFLAELAEQCLRREGTTASKFVAEVRACELAAIIAASFRRPYTAILIHPPPELSLSSSQSLAASCEWLAHHGKVGVWLTGVLPEAFERFQVAQLVFDDSFLGISEINQCAALEKAERVLIQYPPLAGRPHPASRAEQALESALAMRDWAVGRSWNQTFQPHALANSIRVDLVWSKERCVVEVDGPDHYNPMKFEADRRRDVQLQLEGFAVLRFTNDQVLADLATVLSQIERFIQSRRAAQQME